jgi:hypothetical protein
MVDERDKNGPLRARSDLLGIMMCDPENTEALVAIMERELKDIQDTDVSARISHAVEKAAAKADISDEDRDNILFWLTSAAPDVRQMILVRTIEELLDKPECRPSTLNALAKVSSEENVSLVLDWVERGILTLNQAVYVLLYPDSSAALR